MEFKVGETVVYPHHGAALIEDISERIIRGEKRLYLTLRIVQGDLTIQVPADSLEEVGIRNVSDEDRLTEVFAVLREKEIEEPANWSRRYKANGEKLTSGDVKRVAEVVRDLSRRESVRGLSAGGKKNAFSGDDGFGGGGCSRPGNFRRGSHRFGGADFRRVCAAPARRRFRIRLRRRGERKRCASRCGRRIVR